MKILVTCPPMLAMKEQFMPALELGGHEVYCPEIKQTLCEQELISLVPKFDGWIIGDDPATRRVFEAGVAGDLKAVVKWGIGVDNVDLSACAALDIPATNIPNMFGAEVADLAIGYLIGLARETFLIDRRVRKGEWPKNCGISIAGKTVGVVGYGDIGRNTVSRCKALGTKVIVFDPAIDAVSDPAVSMSSWPADVEQCDFLIFTCSLNELNYQMLNAAVLGRCKNSVRIINVARGGLIDEVALCEGLKSGHVHSAALDVFEEEPLPISSDLRKYERCILGSHNASNTYEAVVRTNDAAIDKLLEFLECE